MANPYLIDPWAFPADDISEGEVMFGTTREDLIPPPEEVPQEFWTGMSPWTGALFQWKILHRYAKEFLPQKIGINKEKALRHIFTILGSVLPTIVGEDGKGHYKEAVLSFLLSKWFELPDLYQQQKAFERLAETER